MNTTIIYCAVVLFLTVIGVFFTQKAHSRLRLLCIVLLLALSVDILSFGMGGLRSHIVEVKERGNPKEFVAGMVERDRKIFPQRIQLFFCVLGLTVLAFAKVRDKR